MKKIEYQSPKTQVVELKFSNTLLSMSGGNAPDPNNPEQI